MPRKSTKALRGRAPPQDDPRGLFDLFPKLPEHIRSKIWGHASFVPRVVDVFESHDMIEIDADSGGEEDSEDSDDSGDSRENEDTDNSSLFSEDSYDSEDYEDCYDQNKATGSRSGNGDEGEEGADQRKEDVYKLAGFECITIMCSKTRPPAILSVCRESRAQGLLVYKEIGDGLRTKHPQWSHCDRPIYVNPEVDIIYRSKIACDKGDAFRIRCKTWPRNQEPVAFTPTLAVDLTALSKPRSLDLRDVLFVFDQLSAEGNSADTIEQIFDLTSKSEMRMMMRVREVAMCLESGIHNLIIVVGNDDDMSEVTLIPVERDTVQDPRVKGAFHEADRLRTNLEQYWEESCNRAISGLKTPVIPTIQIMTVKRAPLNYFDLFPKLPVELQEIVWKFALHTPRIIDLEQFREDDEHLLNSTSTINRPPTLLSVCSASRQVALKTRFQNLPPKLHHLEEFSFYNPLVDTVRISLNYFGDPKDFAKYNIKSLGIPYEGYRSVWTASHAKAFVGLEEIVVLVSRPGRTGNCQLRPVPVPEASALDPPTAKFPLVESRTWSFVSYLRRELKRTSQNWKAYQRRRVKQDKSSPDWVMPTVRVAFVEEECQTERPYLYNIRPQCGHM